MAERVVIVPYDPTGDFRVDSMSGLATIRDNEFDMVVSNYVLMDTPDLDGAMKALCRGRSGLGSRKEGSLRLRARARTVKART